mgnify:FL=1
MAITFEEIEKLATLSKLKISKENQTVIKKRLEDVFELVDQLKHTETCSLEANFDNDQSQRLRNGQNIEKINRDELQSCAPEVLDGFYKVPRVID